MSELTQSSIARSSASGGLYNVVELILDRGLVIDAFVHLSLVGIEWPTIDTRVVVTRVNAYLHFAEACNRVDLEGRQPIGLPGPVKNVEASKG
jgi:gas vesicle structural protein